MTVNWMQLSEVSYLIAATLFILAIRGLSSPDTARRGNALGIVAMALAVAVTLFNPGIENLTLIIAGIAIGGVIGVTLALKVKMTAMPQMVAALNAFGGLAASLIVLTALYATGLGGADMGAGHRIASSLGAVIGAVTFTGSFIAFSKLQGVISSKPWRMAEQHLVMLLLALAVLAMLVIYVLEASPTLMWALIATCFVLGVLLVMPIGGADMPVVISLLNSYSGWATVGIGFTLGNYLLIIAGALVGASGAILSYIMCVAMNRSLLNVLKGGLGGGAAAPTGGDAVEITVNTGSAADAAFLLKNAQNAIIVPGYGMAVAQAQHALKEMADKLEAHDVDVRYAIHPVAGRMPGHMNVLLAEANVPYEQLFELDQINRDFVSTDVVYVIGANDVTNPAAKENPDSPIYGMPVLDVASAKTVFFVKRSMAAGYAGVQNALFGRSNVMMLFGDGKDVTEDVIRSL